MTEALARTADLVRADADLLDELAAQALEGLADDSTFDCVGAAALPGALRTRVLRRWLLDRGARDLSRGHVDAVDTLLMSVCPKSWPTKSSGSRRAAASA